MSYNDIVSQKRLDKTQALNLIRRIANEGVIQFSGHALKELKNDDLDRSDAISVLCSASSRIIKQPELKYDRWTYRVETKTICVVVIIEENPKGLIVVTVFKIKRF